MFPLVTTTTSKTITVSITDCLSFSSKGLEGLIGCLSGSRDVNKLFTILFIISNISMTFSLAVSKIRESISVPLHEPPLTTELASLSPVWVNI